jgi:tRNA(adenine34) deaminase
MQKLSRCVRLRTSPKTIASSMLLFSSRWNPASCVWGLAYDKKAGALGSVEDLSDSRALNHRFEVNGGLLADEATALLRSFFESRR